MKYFFYFFILLLFNFASCKQSLEEDDNRFEITVLSEGLNEPTEMSILRDGSVLFLQRKGEVMLYNPQNNQIKKVNHLKTNFSIEDGFLGLAIDPNFEENHWLYIYYSHPTDSLNQLSRFVFNGDSIDTSSEKVILKIPTQRRECCHTGGSLAFDAQGLLYLSTGDNTNPNESDGYSPLDERKGRADFDAQRTAANSKDLRGKILRIKPEKDGTYSIPEGNLFPVIDSLGRPEIYIMGCRNPYRISIDAKTGFLYWGDVGPDAGQDNSLKTQLVNIIYRSGEKPSNADGNDSLTRGSMGYDEINQAKRAGFYGWPLFIADNKPYFRYDFDKQQPLGKFEAQQPLNQSPNNAGYKKLPPAQPAFIWYAYQESEEYPLLGQGGRNAMVGPIYYADKYSTSPSVFPNSYNGKLFIYDWVRGWIMTVSLNPDGSLQSIKEFLKSERFNNPIDMELGTDGSLYVLEYGSKWFSANAEARLLKISYNVGNRKPIVKITADHIAGGAPLKVNFSSEGTGDYDKDSLQYSWVFDENGAKSSQKNPTFIYNKDGIYQAILTVTDTKGAKASSKIDISVGNEKPNIDLQLINANQSFYFDNQSIRYKIIVRDKEDGSTTTGQIKPEEVSFSFNYMSQKYDSTLTKQGHQISKNLTEFSQGRQLLEQSTCKSCHQIDKTSIGPSYQQIAEKYSKQDGIIISKLAKKIIKGGNGSWGKKMMPAHPQFTEEKASEIVKYILSLNSKNNHINKALEGIVSTTKHIGKSNIEGGYFFTVSYKDKGKGTIPPIESEKVIFLRNPIVKAVEADFLTNVDRNGSDLSLILRKNSIIGFKNIDLNHIKKISLVIPSHEQESAEIEVRQGSFSGNLIGKIYLNSKQQTKFITQISNISEGKQDVFFVVKHSNTKNITLSQIIFE